MHGADGGLWPYRRIADRRNFTASAYASDICLVHWPQNDDGLGNICDVTAAEAERHCSRARQLSLSLLYWMQKEAPRADGGEGWPGMRLRPNITGTADASQSFYTFGSLGGSAPSSPCGNSMAEPIRAAS